MKHYFFRMFADPYYAEYVREKLSAVEWGDPAKAPFISYCAQDVDSNKILFFKTDNPAHRTIGGYGTQNRIQNEIDWFHDHLVFFQGSSYLLINKNTAQIVPADKTLITHEELYKHFTGRDLQRVNRREQQTQDVVSNAKLIVVTAKRPSKDFYRNYISHTASKK